MAGECQDSAHGCSVVRFECRCGRTFYMAMSREVPALFALAGRPEEAVEALVAKMGRGGLADIVEVPDYLPPDV